ncbi:MAG: hypothetical protein WBD20_19825 [Pirellulaceae bacterium]
MVFLPSVPFSGRPVWNRSSIVGKSIEAIFPPTLSNPFPLDKRVAMIVLIEGCDRCKRVHALHGNYARLGVEQVISIELASDGRWTLRSHVTDETIDFQWPRGSDPYVMAPVAVIVDKGVIAEVLEADSLIRILTDD